MARNGPPKAPQVGAVELELLGCRDRQYLILTRIERFGDAAYVAALASGVLSFKDKH
jgi:hypothetical protein